MPRHGNVMVERSVPRPDSILHPALALEPQGLVHRKCALVGFLRNQLHPVNVRHLCHYDVEQRGKYSPSNPAPLPRWMDCYGQVAKDVRKRAGPEWTCVNFADDAPRTVGGDKSDSSAQRFIDECAYVVTGDLVGSSCETASSLTRRLIKRNYPVDILER